MKLCFFIAIIFLAILSASSGNNEAISKSQSTDLVDKFRKDSSQMNGMDTLRDELVQYNLPKEGIRVNLGHSADSLFGYVKGDTLIVEGDILFSKRRELTRGIGSTWQIWNLNAGLITIPYEIKSNYKDSVLIHQAFEMWSAKLPIQFIRRTRTTRDYIEFTFSEHTRSYIGRLKGRQPIELAHWASKGNIAHEIGHALGLYHEHSRSDRDMHVKVLCLDDINYRHAFRNDPYAKNIGPYDFFSIMHYQASRCMIPKNGSLPNGIPGQREYITEGDFLAVKRIYGLQ